MELCSAQNVEFTSKGLVTGGVLFAASIVAGIVGKLLLR
jgi:hypothetical protein